MANSPFGNFLFWKKSGKDELKDEDRVILPEIFGIKPWLYLAFLYGAAILLVLFFVLIYPGLSNPGATGVFSSEPAGAAVRVDDVTLGYTPCEIFIPRGKHTLSFVLPGFTQDDRELEVQGRVFGSLFFPSRIEVSGKLDAPDPAAALALAALEYIHWAAAGEPTEAYQIPMVLSEGVYRTAFAAKESRGAMQGILDNALRHTVTKASARDLVRAQFLLDSGGLSPSPLGVVSTVRRAAAQLGNNGEAASWLEFLLSGESARKLTNSRWFQQNTAGPNLAESAGTVGSVPGSLQNSITGSTPPASLNLEGVSFTAAPPILVAAKLVSEEAWARFTRENPEWSAENRDELVNRGLAGEDYLNPMDNASYPAPAVPGISFYAAEAYCAWLSTKLPPSLADWEVRLPSGDEWEHAAARAELDTGLLWEWGSEQFAPLDFFPVSNETLTLMEQASASSGGAPDRTVRGGSWINPPGSVEFESRGSLPPSTSSPFVGFRPVIVPKPEN